MFDSVYVFAAGLTSFGRSHTLRPANLSCDLEQPWQDGLQLYNHISSVSMLNVISFNKIFSPTRRRTSKKKNSRRKIEYSIRNGGKSPFHSRECDGGGNDGRVIELQILDC